MTIRTFFAALAAIIITTPVFAHELWIDAENYQVKTGDQVRAYIRNGQKFKGIDLAYYDRRVAVFDLVDAAGRRPVTARAGDSPAFDAPATQDGLLTLIYQSTHNTVSYATWEKFEKFVEHKAFGDILSKHRARGLAEEGFREVYSRYVKALIGVGDAKGADADRGLEIEIIALKNPYTDDMTAGLPVKVLYREMPRLNVQVEVFEMDADGNVDVTLQHTDDAGIAVIPVKPDHRYLLDNVLLREPSKKLARENEAVWETLWAALTFAVP